MRSWCFLPVSTGNFNCHIIQCKHDLADVNNRHFTIKSTNILKSDANRESVEGHTQV